MDFVSFTRSEHICIEYHTINTDQVSVLLQMLDDMNKEMFWDTVNIFVSPAVGDFIHREKELYSYNYALGRLPSDLDRITRGNHKTPGNKNTNTLFIKDGNIDIQSCLKLLYYGVQNERWINLEQGPIRSSIWGGSIDSITSIVPCKIQQILKMNFPELDTFFKRKYHVVNRYVGGERLHCYFQNGLYHYCSVKKKTDHSIYKLTPKARDNYFNKIIDTILFVHPKPYSIFLNDSVHLFYHSLDSVYYVNLNAKTIKGPFRFPYNFNKGWLTPVRFTETPPPQNDTFVLYDDLWDLTVKFAPKTGRFFLKTNFHDSEFQQRFIDDTTRINWKNVAPATSPLAGKTNPKLFPQVFALYYLSFLQ